MIFFINLPVGVVAVLLLARVQHAPRTPVPFDWTGQVSAETWTYIRLVRVGSAN